MRSCACFLLLAALAAPALGDRKPARAHAAQQRDPTSIAIEKYRLALVANPDDVAAHDALLKLLQARRDYVALVEEYRSWADDHPRESPEVLAVNLKLLLDDPESAIVAWQSYLDRKPPEDQVAAAHARLGKLMLERDRDLESIKSLQVAVEADPNRAEWRMDLGRALEKTSDLQGAVRQFRRALELAPQDPEPHWALGRVLRRMGDRDAQLAEFRAALELKRSAPAAHLRLGNLLLERGDKIGAEPEYRDAIELQPADGYARCKLAELLRDSNRKAEAEEQYRAAMHLVVEEADAHYSIAGTAYGYGDLAIAASELRAAVRLKPQVAPYRLMLGQVLSETGDIAAGVREFQEGLARETKQLATSRHRFGLMLLKAGRDREAFSEFMTAYSLAPHNLTYQADCENLRGRFAAR